MAGSELEFPVNDPPPLGLGSGEARQRPAETAVQRPVCVIEHGVTKQL